ncbi:MAG: 5-(carboxyamino)imidazole ribonucleotide synthase [Saprospiraceae bacterium]
MDYCPDKFNIGVLGGGQLARMLHQESIALGLNINFLDPDLRCSVAQVSPGFQHGNFQDYDDVINFGKRHSIVTIEIENVNDKALEMLANDGVKVFPQPHIIRLIKDKGTQKEFFRSNDFPSAPFEFIQSKKELESCILSGKIKYPFVQKLKIGGYDGRGVSIIKSEEDKDKILDSPSVIEQLAIIKKELSVIAIRSANGECSTYPAVEMEFHPDANLVDILICPAEIPGDIEKKAQQLASDIARKLEIIGLLAVEMFYLEDNTIWINELAPRPHNSGHHTLSNGSVSQFENHLRAITGMPLGDTTGLVSSAMINIIGDDDAYGEPIYPDFDKLISIPGVAVYLYGKQEVRPFRKMGHVSIVAHSLTQCREKVNAVRPFLKVKSKNL